MPESVDQRPPSWGDHGLPSDPASRCLLTVDHTDRCVYLRYTNGIAGSNVSKREAVYEQLRDQILAGDLRPGEVINERTVAESLGSSRVPLREALIELQRDGLVRLVPRRGAFVRTFSAPDVQHLYELREALEGLAAARAALVLPPGAMTT